MKKKRNGQGGAKKTGRKKSSEAVIKTIKVYAAKNRKIPEQLRRGLTAAALKKRTVETLDAVFSASGRGYGFAVFGDGRADAFIPPYLTGGAMQGDGIAVHMLRKGDEGYGRGNECAVVAVTRRAITTVYGTYENGVVIPDDDKLRFRLYVADAAGASDGDKVEAEILKYPDDIDDVVRGRITDVLGGAYTREANYKAILRQCGIPVEFTPEAAAEAEAAAKEALSPDGRLDLRDKIVFTIDGAGAKDLDDAISLERDGDKWLLGVHIADVSHYVGMGGALDAAAYERGTSVYFTDKVVPMLPVALSNGACSLNAGEDKYALSALMTLDRDGRIIGAKLAKTMIRSAVRGVYEEVNDIFERGGESEFAEKYAAVLPTLYLMRDLYELLAANARSRGALELEESEAEITLDESGAPVDIMPRTRGTGERLIEQFMLCANEAVARWLREANLPALYRVHDDPDPEKVGAFAVFAVNMGLSATTIKKGGAVAPAALSAVMDEAREKDVADIVSGVMLRSLAKAKYSVAPTGHFGLAVKDYCHFTSPIRRYPDLFVHRAVSAALAGDDDAIEALRRSASAAADDTSACEQRAVNAERAIDDLYKTIYMSRFISEEVEAVVSGVTPFGLFARTAKLCEGMIPVTSLDGDWEPDTAGYRLVSGSRSIALGDTLIVRVDAADVISRRVTFGLVKVLPRKAKTETAKA